MIEIRRLNNKFQMQIQNCAFLIYFLLNNSRVRNIKSLFQDFDYVVSYAGLLLDICRFLFIIKLCFLTLQSLCQPFVEARFFDP